MKKDRWFWEKKSSFLGWKWGFRAVERVQQGFGDQGGASLRCGREEEAFFKAKTRLELGGKQGREREAVPPRLPSGWAAGHDLDRLRGVFREPDGTTASGWNDAEVSLSDFCTLTPFPRLRGVFREPEGTNASSWKDAEWRLSDFCTLTPFLRPWRAVRDRHPCGGLQGMEGR